MASPQQTAKELVSAIAKSVDAFNASVPGLQKDIANEIELLVKQLDLKNGRIVPSAQNLKLIAQIKAKILKVIMSKDFVDKRNEYLKSFQQVTALQNNYFTSVTKKFKPSSVLKELQKQSLESTLESLSRAGIDTNVARPVQDILRANITAGAKYTDLVQQMRDYITTNQTGAGKLERYVKQITTDALNQYSRQYTKVVTDDLGLEWFMYTGAEIESSRPFCKAMLDKKYFHRDEIPDLLNGNFPEFKKNDGKINKKTDLPEGMIPGTNVENFFAYAGGYNCGHQIVPVDESSVPESLKNKLERPGITLQETYLPDYGTKLSEEIFKGVGDTKFIVRDSAEGSYFIPGEKEVVISNGPRFQSSPWYREHIVYHEGGHATHHEQKIVTMDFVDSKFRKAFNNARSEVINDADALHTKLEGKFFNAKAKGDADTMEKISATADMLAALTKGEYGWGHSAFYFKRYNSDKAEAFAHASEIYHGKNDVMEEVLPEVHKIFRTYMADFYSNL